MTQTFEYLSHWFQRAKYTARLAGKHDSAKLWEDGYEYLKEAHERAERYRTALEMISNGTEDYEAPFRCAPSDVLRRIARDALKVEEESKHETP